MLGLGTGITDTKYKWNPKFVPATLQLWLRNNVGVTAAAWDDSSGNANHVTQETVGNQATPKEGGLDFEASNDDHYNLTEAIEIGAEEAFIIFMVFKVESYDAPIQNTLFGVGGTASFLEIQASDRLRLKMNPDVDIISYGTGAFAAGEKMVFCLKRASGSTGTYSVFKNGTELTGTAIGESNLANENALDITVLGTRNPSSPDREFDGIIYEVLVYTSADLRQANIDKINSYLKIKHGL